MFVTQVEAAGRRRYGKRETPVTGGDRREEVCQKLRSAHLRSPFFALSEALRRVDVWEDAGSPAGGSRG